MNNIKYNWEELPDPQKMHKPVGANVNISKVGIRAFSSPVDFERRDGTTFREKGVFSAYVELSESVKGINMSRIPIVIQDYTLDKHMNLETFCNASKEMLTKLETDSSYLKMRFDFPMKQHSLRSKNKETGKPNFGWMYYPIEVETRMQKDEDPRIWITISYTYSSTCPCSFSMSESYRSQTQEPAIPHSQRSIIKTTVEINPKEKFYIEDLIELHRKTITTEVLSSIVKREDELQFAIDNAKQPKFVEDSVRMMFEVLNNYKKIKDFVIVADHFESLHEHQATAIIYKGIPGGLR